MQAFDRQKVVCAFRGFKDLDLISLQLKVNCINFAAKCLTI